MRYSPITFVYIFIVFITIDLSHSVGPNSDVLGTFIQKSPQNSQNFAPSASIGNDYGKYYQPQLNQIPPGSMNYGNFNPNTPPYNVDASKNIHQNPSMNNQGSLITTTDSMPKSYQVEYQSGINHFSEKEKDKNNAFFRLEENVALKTNDMISCKVTRGNDMKKAIPSDFKILTPALTTSLIFTYLPVTSTENCFSVKVRAENYAYISLSVVPYQSHNFPMFDIGLGKKSKTSLFSSIRKNFKEVDNALTPNILNPDNYSGFWVSWKNGKISVGQEENKKPFLTYDNLMMFPVNYIGIATVNNTGNWIIPGESICPDVPKNNGNENIETECWLDKKNNNKKSSRLSNLIDFQKSVLDRMKFDYSNFLSNDNIENNTFILEMYKEELKDFYKKSKEIQNEIIFNIIDSNTDSEFTSEVVGNVFDDIQSIFYKYFEHLQKSITENTPSNNSGSKCSIEDFNFKAIPVIAEFYEILTGGCFGFNIQTSALKDAIITLTDNVKKSLQAYITIGRTSEIKILKGHSILENIKKSTNNSINLNKNNQSFWISWNAEKLFIGTVGMDEAFITTKVSNNFDGLKYVNINIASDLWKIEEVRCPVDLTMRNDN